jgi:hypothetical protein
VNARMLSMRARGLLVCALVVGGALALAWVLDVGKETPDYGNMTREEVQNFFARNIEKQGAEKAYADFASAAGVFSIDEQHVLAHAFGEALYAARGIEGFPVCDLRFMYGCFHELMGRSIGEHGVSIVPAIYTLCIGVENPKPFACLHGIGHGIIASSGYSAGELRSALRSCDGLSAGRLSFWCYSGVFMEYNQQSMLGVEYVRQISKESPLEPCLSVSGEYRHACAFELPPLWFRALFLGAASPESFSDMGEMCERFSPDALLVRACFEGLGNIATPAAKYDERVSLELCESASNTRLHRLFCRSAAALSFSSALHDTERAVALCEGLSGGESEFCLAYARGEANMQHPRALPAP